jgi:organic radical activating enzyme
MSIPAVLSEIYKIREKYPVSTLIVTGGEPTLQAEQLDILITILRDRKDITHIDLETNGTVPKYCENNRVALSDWMRYFNHYIVSPKSKTKIYDLIKLWQASDNANFFLKFVCDDSKEIGDWLLNVVKYLTNMKRENVFLMSAGTNAQELRERDKRTIEICKEADVRFSPRVHSYIWGLKKGV